MEAPEYRLGGFRRRTKRATRSACETLACARSGLQTLRITRDSLGAVSGAPRWLSGGLQRWNRALQTAGRRSLRMERGASTGRPDLASG
jgi:hypothetical protein